MACKCGNESARPEVIAESVSMALGQIRLLPSFPDLALDIAKRSLRLASGECIDCVYRKPANDGPAKESR